MSVRSLYRRGSAFAETDRGKRLIKWTRTGFAAAVVGILVYQITEIGWGRLLSSLPTQPLFYVLVVAMYFLLPVTESLIYGRLWSLRPFEGLGIMIRKRVLNVDVVGYSGEVYLLLWAKERVAATGTSIMGSIKDNLILSSAASLLAAALLIGALLLTGSIALADLVPSAGPIYVALGTLAVLFAGAIAFRFRGIIFSLPRRALSILGIAHLGRFATGYVLQVAAWWVVIPTATFETWALLLVLFVLINRIPFVPSSDLVFVSAGAGITPLLDVPAASVVGMLLVRSAIDRLLNLVFFATTVWFEKQGVSWPRDTSSELESADLPQIDVTDSEHAVPLKT